MRVELNLVSDRMRIRRLPAKPDLDNRERKKEDDFFMGKKKVIMWAQIGVSKNCVGEEEQKFYRPISTSGVIIIYHFVST